MIQITRLKKTLLRAHRPSSRFGCPKNKGLNAGVNHGARTHCAWLKRDIKRRGHNAIIFLLLCGLPERHHLGVSSWIIVQDHSVMATTYDDPIGDQHRPDRHFTEAFSQTGLFKRKRHKSFIACKISEGRIAGLIYVVVRQRR